MTQYKFADNYQDMSQSHGVDAGFQFQFYCERCSDAWRTQYKPYRSGQASGWIAKAAGMFGGVLGNASSAIDGVAQAGWNSARDEAFKEAVEQAAAHFHRCAKCFQYVCDRCWDNAKGLCFNCAPDVNVEIEAARNQGELQGASERAYAEGQQRAGRRDVQRNQQLVCPSCHAETHGAKFCPECGTRQSQKVNCTGCHAEMEPGTKFCPECGQRQQQP